MLICPKCKLLYEKSTNCIRCGSSLVEKTSSEKEETNAPPPSEINQETPPIQETKDRKEELSSTQLFDFEEKFPPAPKPKVKKVKEEEEETESVPDMKNALPEALTDEESLPDLFPSKAKRETSRSEKIQIRIPRLSQQNISIIILILIGGYLLWSIYSYFSPKKSDTNVPSSKKSTSRLPPRAVTSAKPPAPLKEPKVADHEKLDKKPSISGKETAVSPSTHSTPIASKTSLSDEKEIEHIKKLFENIREANLRKDIDLFISCYSAAFKGREGKKREILKNWENFTYINLSYTLKEHSISGDTAGVKIAWVILFSSKAGGPTQESKTLLDVTLNKEPDGWKIKNIKTAS